MLAQQIQQRGFKRRDGMDRDAQVEGLHAASARVAIGKLPRARQSACCCRRRCVLPTTRARASSSVWRIVSPPGTSPTPIWPELSVRMTMIAGEERAVRAAQVEQHAVAPGDRDHLHCSNYRRAGETGASSVLNHVILPRQARFGLRSSPYYSAASRLRAMVPGKLATSAATSLDTRSPSAASGPARNRDR